MKTITPFTVLVATAVTFAFANAQDKAPDADVAPAESAPAEVESSHHPKNISFCFEVFSLPLTAAAALQRLQLNDPALYARLTSSVEKNEATQEAFMMLHALSGMKAVVESNQEMIYPTEYESARISESKAHTETDVKKEEDEKAAPVVTSKANGFITPAHPTAYQTRNLGFTLELEPTLLENQTRVDLRLLPEHVVFAGRSKWGQGFSETEMPDFETQRINTAVTVWIDRPFFLGTMNPPPVSKVNPDSAKRVWFAFVTATFRK